MTDVVTVSTSALAILQVTNGTAQLTPPVLISQGGTGQITQQAAMDALAGAVTSAQYLRGNGTHVVMAAIAAADLPGATGGAQGAIQLAGDIGGGTSAAPQVTSTHLSAALPVNQGGTARTAAMTASASFAPSNPSTTASLTLVMMGFGFTGPAVSFTPSAAGSGKVLVIVSGVTGTNTGAVSVLLGGRFGAAAPASAPQNGNAVTGTAFGAATDLTMRGQAAGVGVGFTIHKVITLTPGTQYWFDLALDTANASDAAFVASVMFSFSEQVI